MINKTYNFLKNHYFYLVGVFFVYICLLPRLHSGFDFGNYLWSEDGPVFFNEANQYGFHAIWQTYAGYLHIYPRLIAWGASFIPIAYIPIAYLLGWLVAFSIATVIIMHCAKQMALSRSAILILLSFIVLQPNNGEIFFSLTNSQWFLGLALIIAVSTLENVKLTKTKFLAISVTCLTGPFSLIASPIIFLRVLLTKSFSGNKSLYALVILGACAQVYFLVTKASERKLLESDFNLDAIAWIKSLIIIMLYGAYKYNYWTIFFAILYWILVFYLLYRAILKSSTDNSNNSLYKILSCLMAGIILNYLVVAVAFKNPYYVFNLAVSGGNRYTFIPYTLIFFASILLSQFNKKILYAMVFCAYVLCVLEFRNPNRQNLFFSSFVEFANFQSVDIPINPAAYPRYFHSSGWNLSANNKKILMIKTIKPIKLNFVKKTSKGDLTQFETDQSIECKNTSTLAVEVNMIINDFSTLTLFWNHKNFFTEKNSLSRYYPEGKVKAQFAFPNSQQSNYLLLAFDKSVSPYTHQLAPSKTVDPEIINAVAYCIGKSE